MTRQIHRILVPIDFSEHSREAFQYAATLARAFKASIDVLHIGEPPKYATPEVMLQVPGWRSMTPEELSRTEAKKEMELFLEGIDKTGLLWRMQIGVGNVTETILDRAADGYDLIVMGTHGRTGLARVAMGSVAAQVASKARCPVLTVRVPAGQDAQVL